MCKSRPYKNPLYDINDSASPYECPNKPDCSEPSVDKQEDVYDGVESESHIYEDLGHFQEIITARPLMSDAVKDGCCDQEVICNAQAFDQENIYDDIQLPVNSMPESEQHQFSNPCYVAVQTPEDKPASDITLLHDKLLPENDPENFYDDVCSPVTGEDLYEEIAEWTHKI